MISPTYANQVEINTIYTKEEGHLVEFRFFYQHPPISQQDLEKRMADAPFPIFPLTMGPVIIMNRAVAKEMLKRFLTFIAQQDEAKPKDIPPIPECPACKQRYFYFVENGKMMRSCKCGTKEDIDEKH